MLTTTRSVLTKISGESRRGVAASTSSSVGAGERDPVAGRLPADQAGAARRLVRVVDPRGDPARVLLHPGLAVGGAAPRRPDEARPLAEVLDPRRQRPNLLGVRLPEVPCP